VVEGEVLAGCSQKTLLCCESNIHG